MKKVFISILAVFMVIGITGCDWFAEPPQKDAKEIVKEAMDNLYDVKSMSYDFYLTVVTNPPSGQDETSDYFMAFEGGQDMSNPKSPKFAFEVKIRSWKKGGEDQFLEGELRMDGRNLYFLLSNLTDFDGAIPTESIDPLTDQWWKIPLPEDTWDEYAFTMADEENLTEKEKKMKELVENMDWFKDLEYVGIEKGNYHYKGILDNEAVKDLVYELSEISEEPLSDNDKQEMEILFDSMEMTADLYVDIDDNILTRFDGVMTIDTSEGGNIELEFESSMDDFNKSFDVKIPEGSQEFDPYALIGPLMMLGGMNDLETDMYDDFGMGDLYEEMEMTEEEFAEMMKEFEVEMEEMMKEFENFEY